MNNERFNRGLAVRREVLGSEYVDRSLAGADDFTRPIQQFLGDGKGGFTEAAGSPFDLGHAAWYAAVADFDGDGKTDVVAAAGDGVRLLLCDGRGSFAPAPGSPFLTGMGTWQLAVGDVNGDGKPDVATSNLEADTVSVLLAR